MKKGDEYNLRSMEGNQGVAIILTLIFMTSLVVIASAYLFITTYSTRNNNAQRNNVAAAYLAESGLNQAVYYLENTAPDGSTNGSWRTTGYPADPGEGDTDPRQESLGDGTYTMWVEDSGSNALVTARGTVNGVERVIQQEVQVSSGWPAAFNFAAYGETTTDQLRLQDNVTLNGSLYYDYSGGSVTVDEDSEVAAPYYIYADTVEGDGTYTQAPGEADPVPTLPAFDTTSYDDAISTAGSEASSNLTLKNSDNLDLGGGTVYYKSITVKNSATITGPGTIVATKDVTIKNSANIGEGVTIITAKNLTAKDSSVVQSGGILYAQKDITLQNDADVTGSVIAPENNKSVIMKNDAVLTGIIYSDVAELKGDAVLNGAVVTDSFANDKIKDNVEINYDSDYFPASIPAGLESGAASVTSVSNTWSEI